MRKFSTLYEILNVPESAAADEIKSAFRKLAHIYHPDKNGNTPDSAARFIVIHHAYSVLTDPEKRAEYDSYLGSSPSVAGNRKSAAKYRTSLPGSGSWESILADLNFILWDIEELIRDNRMGRNDDAMMKILVFIDRWVLVPSGYPDYFYEARKMDVPIGNEISGSGHRPYISVKNYFYDIRKRANKMLEKAAASKVMSMVDGTDRRIIDCVIESVNLARHTLSFLGGGEIPPFSHSSPVFLKPLQ
jgi:curved DNA-binding protein CbpA